MMSTQTERNRYWCSNFLPNAYATTKLKVTLSTNSPLGTPATESTETYRLAGPGFGKLYH
jgi:hypothetical protein